jgi:hypothetical protein
MPTNHLTVDDQMIAKKDCILQNPVGRSVKVFAGQPVPLNVVDAYKAEVKADTAKAQTEPEVHKMQTGPEVTKAAKPKPARRTRN